MPNPFDFQDAGEAPRRAKTGGGLFLVAVLLVLLLVAAGVGFWMYQAHQQREMERLYYLHAVQEHYCKTLSQLGANREADQCIAIMFRLNTESVNRFGAICPALPLPETTKAAIVTRVRLQAAN